MTPDQETLVMSLVTMPDGSRKLTPEEFLQRFGESDGSRLGLRLLNEAVLQSDADGVELALIVAWVFGVSSGYLPVLVGLARADWHHSHEDVVGLLQRLGADETVDALLYLTRWVPPYLEFDESRALAVKAVWALSKIGSPSAMEALGEVAVSGAPPLRKLALERMGREAEE